MQRIIRSQINRLRNLIPEKLHFPGSYFYMKNLIKKKQQQLSVQRELDEALAAVLKTALGKVPYYRELGLGIKAEEVTRDNAQAVFRKFPFIDKKVVSGNEEAFLSEDFQKKDLRFLTTGGTTGYGLKLWTNRSNLYVDRAFIDYRWGQVGFQRNSKLVRIGCDGIRGANESPFSNDGYKLLISPYHLNEDWFPVIIKELLAFGVEFIHAYPSSLELLLNYLQEKQVVLPGLKAIFLGSERVSLRILDLIRAAFGEIPVVINYGLTERTNMAWGIRTGPRISYQCEELYGITENYFNNDGFGEIVGTSYWNQVMPLIRYRTQDYGKVENGLITEILGREQQVFLTKSGHKIFGHTVAVDDFIYDYVTTFQVVQNEVGKVELHVVPKANYNQEIGQKILQAQETKWGGYFDLTILTKEKVTTTRSGKVLEAISNIVDDF